MKKTRITVLLLLLLAGMAVFVQAAGESQFIANSLQALVYNAMQIQKFFPELDPVGAAIGELDQAVLEGQTKEAFLLLGLVYQSIGENEQAAIQYARFLQHNPDEGWAYALLGDAYFSLGEVEFAEVAYRASTDYGTYARSHYGLGNVHLTNQDYDSARAAFEEALEEAPEFLDARLGLGKSLYFLGSYDEALEVLELSQLIDPRSIEIHSYLALTYDALGRTEQAQHARERIAELTP